MGRRLPMLGGLLIAVVLVSAVYALVEQAKPFSIE
jgi:hypothetical protein